MRGGAEEPKVMRVIRSVSPLGRQGCSNVPSKGRGGRRLRQRCVGQEMRAANEGIWAGRFGGHKEHCVIDANRSSGLRNMGAAPPL